ncbi:unnamed protein product [Hydatigera taeniaeformis]|uniref:SUZ domain-containing protein n=1 Tax=Hydatigena taeniaeformis TaxID=6205 RepID=A0A0R3WU27_HYDTA|nr:unnamed protein product [Hydatigera taeniaeformis]
MPNWVPRANGTLGVKSSGQAAKPPLSHATSSQPSKIKGNAESIDHVIINTTSDATVISTLELGTTSVDPSNALLFPPQSTQGTLLVENRQENGTEASLEARKKAVEAALKRYECARQASCEYLSHEN